MTRSRYTRHYHSGPQLRHLCYVNLVAFVPRYTFHRSLLYNRAMYRNSVHSVIPPPHLQLPDVSTSFSVIT